MLWLVALLVMGASLMIDREDGVPAADAAERPAIGPPVDLKRLAQPEELSRFCDLVRQRNREMELRHHGLVHVETTTTQELDRNRKVTGGQRVVERVWFVDHQEHRLLLKKEDLRSGKDLTPANVKEETRPKSDVLFPFSTNEPTNAYRYTCRGLETINGRATIHFDYEPNPPVDNKFRGQVWIDVQSLEPIRFFGAWARLPALVNEMTMLLDWGPAENGLIQLRHSLVVGSGGIAFLQRHFRIETELTDYRPAEGN
jgi:hypothetical protein